MKTDKPPSLSQAINLNLATSTTKILLNHPIDQLDTVLHDYKNCLIISTPSIYQLFGKTLKHQLDQLAIKNDKILFPDGEAAKSLSYIKKCWLKMSQQGLDRHSLVIALGGGALTDAAGFAAGCYMRGIDTMYIPTTLMGMIDAAIGNKTGINFDQRKNFIGLFHSPKQVIIDPQCLKTLPQRELNAGFGEIIKYGMIASESLFELLEKMDKVDESNLKKIIELSCVIKAKIISEDPFDKGNREILNYGHTFAHALEDLTNYQVFLHGEAVSIGMCCAAGVSCEMQLLEKKVLYRLEALCQKMSLPTEIPDSIDIDLMINKMREDKKAHNQIINLIIPEKIGQVKLFKNADPNLIKKALYI